MFLGHEARGQESHLWKQQAVLSEAIDNFARNPHSAAEYDQHVAPFSKPKTGIVRHFTDTVSHDNL